MLKYFDEETKTDMSRQENTEIVVEEKDKALHDMEVRFHAVVDHTILYYWEYEVENDRAQHGQRSLDDLNVKKVMENYPESFITAGNVAEESTADFRQLHAEIKAGASIAERDIRLKLKNGSSPWVRVVYTTLFDKGHAVTAIGTSIDITAEKEATRLYQEEIDYRKSLGENLVASHRVNLTKQIMEESYSKIHKKPLTSESPMNNDIFWQICLMSIPDEEIRIQYYNMLNPYKMLRDYNNGTTNLEMEYQGIIAETDEIRWLKVHVKLLKKPGTEDVIAFFNTWDIHEQKTAQLIIDAVVAMDYDYVAQLDAIKNTYTIYTKLENGDSQPPFFTSDYESEVRQYAQEHLLEEDIEQNIKDMSYQNLFEQLERAKIYTTFCRTKEKEGKISRKKLQFTYLKKDEKKILVTRSDVTGIYEEEQRKNEALEAALMGAEQANAAKSDFLSRMSHEIRTPMNAIIGMAAIAAQSIGDDNQVSDCISKIGISSRFLLSLINDILDMSRIESGKVLLKKGKIPFEEFINEINSICYSQADSKNIDYECIVEHNLDDYYIGDAMKLQQIIINILANAVKFTPEGGRVSIHIQQMKKMKNDAILRFTINDTGCGISDYFLSELFEPFTQEHSGTTTMYSGTGLGLSICKHLVDLMDGTIKVRSIVGVGSEFVVELKLGITEESKISAAKKPIIDFEQLRALVVDDDVIICEHTELILKDIGVKSEWVDSGPKAVDRVQNKWAKHQYYDLILIDWKMPEMDGIETARRIRKIVGPEVTIIIMTAFEWAAIEQDAKLAGVNLLMNKPMFKSSLISAFERTLAKQEDEKRLPKLTEFNFTGKRLLMAEDHPLNTEVALKLLHKKGFEVDVAVNGVRAIEMFTVADEGYYDAILMDIRMPVMDGLQAAQTIRHLSKRDSQSIPIIAMTANAFDDDIEKSKESGMNAHLAKPIEPKVLYQTLYDFLCRNEQT